MDLRKLVSFCSLLFLILGISFLLLVSLSKGSSAKEKSEPLPCCAAADTLSDEDYARAIQKGLEKQKEAGGNR